MRRQSSVERYLPLSYLALAFALVVALLPSTLRPPEPPPPTSAEFDPDAPPEEPETIISDLGQGSTATAGAGTTIAVGEALPEEIPPTVIKPRSCKFGVGNPPRQTESPYAPACAPSFVGDNGGATWRGVTGNEIRIAIGSTVDGQNTSYDGPTREPQSGDNAQDRTYRAWEAYFNEAFELYGRSLKFIHFTPGTGENQGRARMLEVHEEYQPFAVLTTHQGSHDEATRLGYVAFGSYQRPREYYLRDAPYAWSWVMDGTKLVRVVAEFLCKQAVGRPPEYNERMDQSFDYTKPRKFGVVLLDTQDYQTLEQPFRERFSECGAAPDEFVYYNFGTSGDAGGSAGSFGTMVTRMRAAGVTTVVCFCDFLAMIPFLGSSTNQGYFPEWIVTATSAIDTNTVGQLYDPQQWRHAFGISFYEMAMPQHMRDYYKAYKHIDPDREPHAGAGRYIWPFLYQMVVGLQSAGPNLTPDSFIEGLYRYEGRRNADPPWYVAGGYSPGDFTFADYVSFVWWDPLAIDPDSRQPGAYRHLDGGTRYHHGELPSEPKTFFSDGVAGPPDDAA